MARVFHDIWILTSGGITIFNTAKENTVKNDNEEQLFGMGMSSLNTFASSFSEQGLSNVELEDSRFTFLKKNEFIFIGSSPLKVKLKKVYSELELISKSFFKSCPEDFLDNWNGDTSVFSDFGNEIKDKIKDSLKSGDEFIVTSKIEPNGRIRFNIIQDVIRKSDSKIVCSAINTATCLFAETNRPKIPEELKKILGTQ